MAHELTKRRRIQDALTGMLPPGDPVQQIEAILDRPDLEGYIEALDPRPFFQLLHDAGWDQAVDLIPYATPHQLQCFLDFDVWRRDELVPTRLNRWLDVLVAEASDEHFKTVCRELDPEVLGIYFKAHVEVYETEEGQIPDWLPMHARLSPDGVYAVVFVGEDEDTFDVMWRLLLRLYELDRVLAWSLLEAARWELMSELQESAYRWRLSRLEELGFVDESEAQAVYKLLDPVRTREQLDSAELGATRRARAPESLDMPVVMREELHDDLFLVQAIERVEDDQIVATTLYELMALQNRALVADGIEPGELSAGREVIRRTMGYASLGLDYLARTELDRAAEILGVMPLQNIFRVGYTLAAKLQQQARQLTTRPTLTLVDEAPHGLAGDDDAALLDALLRRRPTWARNVAEFDIFRSQAQLDEAALRLGQLAFKQLWLFALQGATTDALIDLVTQQDLGASPDALTIDLLLRTWLSSALVRGAADCRRGLDTQELEKLSALLRAAPWRDGGVEAFFQNALDEIAARVPGAGRKLMARWIEASLDRLTEELGGVAKWRDTSYAAEVVLITPTT